MLPLDHQEKWPTTLKRQATNPQSKNSYYISEKLQPDYTCLAHIFSQTTGTIVEYFIINHKIEKVKELLLYDELNLPEISYKFTYSSVAHLSSQF